MEKIEIYSFDNKYTSLKIKIQGSVTTKKYEDDLYKKFYQVEQLNIYTTREYLFTASNQICKRE